MADLEWCIYYAEKDENGNHIRFTNLDGNVEDAPALRAILVQQKSRIGYSLLSPERVGDFFIYRDGKWWNADYNGLLQYVLGILGTVKFGEMVSPDDFDATIKEAVNNKDFGPKRGYLAPLRESERAKRILEQK